MTSVLDKIAQYKWEEIKFAKKQCSVVELQSLAQEVAAPKGFYKALKKASQNGFGLIAEIKKASPSKGVICKHFDPATIAKAYWRGGASCLSILTDTPSFQGSLQYLTDVSNTVPLPCLRKDFMLDPYQIWEARAAGADCILIIMAMVSDMQAAELEDTALNCGMDCLIEIHDLAELQRAENMQSRLIGVNNRNLKTFNVTIDTTLSLLPHISAKDITVVAESGLKSRSDLDQLATAGVRCFLIGESLMESSEPENAVKQLLSPPFQMSMQ